MTLTHEQFARLTLEEAASQVIAGECTATDLVEAAISRMDAFEPKVNSVITRNDDQARARAAAMDAEKPHGAVLPGLPVAVKDNLMTRGLRSTCGSKILENFIPPYTATVVERIQSAGAIVPAKTNMDEFAMGATGESSAYGMTRNPWNLDRVPGGSSSGSAAIVAYGGALAALGSDTGGSIRLPAVFCGIVGMRPTYGRVSRYGCGALASSLDQVGPMTRTVRDNALLMDILSGHDRRDSTSAPQADSAEPCHPTVEDGVKGLRIGFDPALLDQEGISPVQAGAVRRTVDICRQGGAEIVEVSTPLLKYGVAAYYLIVFCEASANMTRYDGVRYGVRQGDGDLWDVFSTTRGQGLGDEVKRRIMLGSYALSSGYYDAYYLKASRVRRLFVQEFTSLLSGLDALLMPVSPQPPRMLGEPCSVLDSYLGDIFNLPASLTSLPSLAFPVGVFDSLPAGVQVMGGAFRENILYRVAREAEKNSRLDNAPWTMASPEGSK